MLVLHFVQLADWTRGHFGGRVCEQQGSLIPSGMSGMLVPVLSTVTSIPAICDLKTSKVMTLPHIYAGMHLVR